MPRTGLCDVLAVALLMQFSHMFSWSLDKNAGMVRTAHIGLLADSSIGVSQLGVMIFVKIEVTRLLLLFHRIFVAGDEVSIYHNIFHMQSNRVRRVNFPASYQAFLVNCTKAFECELA